MCFVVQLYLEFLDKFERKFVTQGAYDTQNIFQALDLAWTLLHIFPVNFSIVFLRRPWINITAGMP
jgi:vacuolar-type H+-ATPase subunit B/Vma2